MSGCVHPDIPLAGKPRMPWGISAVTCNSGQEDTSFAHHSDLKLQISPEIRSLCLVLCIRCFLDDTTSRAAARPLHD